MNPYFLKPSALERAFNRIFGVLVGLGLGRPHNYLLQVRGRTTSRVFATPVNVLELAGRRYLVAGRGRTAEGCRVRGVPDDEKLPILAAYLARYATTVQRYFPVRPGASPDAFAEVADRYPVFELRPL